jgi:hypothetical protein
MSDWMNALRQDVENEIKDRSDADLIAESVRQSAAQLVAMTYEKILKDIQSGELFAFNRTVLSEGRGEVRLRFPGNIINAGEFFLDLGPLRLKVKWDSAANVLRAQLWQCVNYSEKALTDSDSRFTVESDGTNLLIESENVRSLTSADEIKRRLFATLYRHFMRDVTNM